MNVLVVSEQWPWPAHQGDHVRLDAIVRTLAATHRVTLLGQPGPTRPAIAGVDAVALPVTKRVRSLAQYPRLPSTVALRMDAALRQTITQVAAKHHRVLFYQLKTTAWLDSQLPPEHVVVDLTDSLALYYRRRGGLWRIEARRAHQAERDIATRYATTVVSDHDREAIDPDHTLHVIVAPNGYWTPVKGDRRPEPNQVIAVGNWHYYPNQAGIRHFTKRVWPHVQHANPAARLWVVGRGPNPLPTGVPGVEWIGEVDDLGDWYQRAAVAVAPVYVGAGMKTKIMEALFYHLPVVATALGAEGIDPTPVLLAAKDDQGLARGIVQGLATPPSWPQAAWETFVQDHAWTLTLRPLVRAVEQGMAP